MCPLKPTENSRYAGWMVYLDPNKTVQINRPVTDGNSFDFHMEANGKPTNKRVAAL
jgi:hypothetical protein